MHNPITIQEAKISSKACECFFGSIVCGRRPAGEFMREGWPDSMILCTNCEADDHSHERNPLDLQVFHLTGELAAVSREASEHAAARAKLVDELRAVRVLDAWAMKNDRQVPGIYYVGDTWHLTGSTFEPLPWEKTPALARIAAAEALAKEDPSLLEGI